MDGDTRFVCGFDGRGGRVSLQQFAGGRGVPTYKRGRPMRGHFFVSMLIQYTGTVCDTSTHDATACLQWYGGDARNSLLLSITGDTLFCRTPTGRLVSSSLEDALLHSGSVYLTVTHAGKYILQGSYHK